MMVIMRVVLDRPVTLTQLRNFITLITLKKSDGDHDGGGGIDDHEHDEDLDFTMAPVCGTLPWEGASRPSIA